MKVKLCLLLLLLNVIGNVIWGQHNIIPIPVEYSATESNFTLDGPIRIEDKSQNQKIKVFISDFSKYLGHRGIATTNDSNVDKIITITVNDRFDASLGEEGYWLTVNEKVINITANKEAGVFNSFQTIKQLIPIRGGGPLTIAGCTIVDYPRFGWRGLMLDVSRHFFTVDEVKSYIDKMSEYKFNVFHWHLSDDNGWRIEIKSLPKLTEVGAWRVERHGKFGSSRSHPQADEPTPYGGFYTQEQIKDVVAYAAARNITIVPEIDMPGHSMAALAAYPELSTRKEPKFVNPGSKFAKWYGDGKFEMLIENMLNPIDEAVYEFADKVFTEVAALFPGEYIHMGGDECYHGYWEKDASVKAFMKSHNIENSHELQNYFVNRIEKIISSKGKKMIGWDEILEGDVTQSAAIMSWRGMKGGIEAAKLNHDVVMSPTTFAYLDYTQGDHSVENPIYASLSLEKTYEFDPLPAGVDPKYILGGQANLWTESIATMPFAFYMTYPRAFAISESLWSKPDDKNWNDFMGRTEVHFERFASTHTNICKAVYEPIVNVYKEGEELMCELKNSVPDIDLYYTIDNTYPVHYGSKYTEPFVIPQGKLMLRTQSFLKGRSVGRELRLDHNTLAERVK